MKKTNRLIILLAIIKIIVPYLLQHRVYEPHRDEFLYLAEAHHMAWGYLEVPPLLSVFAWLTDLFGNSCGNYGQAGAINFFGEKYQLPKAYSDNGSFLLWMPDLSHTKNLVLVTDDLEEMQKPYIQLFDSARVVDSITNIYAREYGSLIIVLKNPAPSFLPMMKKKLDMKRNLFQ